ncbi:MAG: ADP-forming succinate--CoA ligase subunit beta [Gammaproteobacteria bacterium]|nr:ADP-forming succinate--CoA ligase subunit beta [Gammaproteobacteria bacterium]NNC98036.1 ADP-forming succinate--CoA ligase subunit beta [Gammaproteobacteria bacterium]NNM14094.1 ADP-forming succinate--CoA ligase subunit beta [Gammaproteobacteria bacterium]
MNLHEYQSKQVFRTYAIPVPEGIAADSPDNAVKAAKELGGELWVVKAQVHAGGRGKAGGVKLCRSFDEVREAAKALIGGVLVTHQTGPEGLPINIVYVESGSQIERELYLSFVIDRASERVSVMASADGGMDIEEVAEKTPERIVTTNINPVTGMMPYQARALGFGIGLGKAHIREFTKVLLSMYKLFIEKDLSMLEINPLIITKDDRVIALDAKVNIEDNSLFRQTEMKAYRDISQEDEMENRASAHDLNYVTLDGDIACMVNGAGLAMATMDLIKLHGGEPANFLDVGGGATAERVTEAFKLILSNKKVKAVLVNIFGGIVRCDLIAEGIIQAVKEVGVKVPVIARLEGTNVEKGRELLANSGLDILAADGLTDAAKKAVAAA